MTTIELTGWTKVHTWHEPHGNGHDDIYQRDSMGLGGKVVLLTVCTRRDQPTSVRTEVSLHDYLLAAAIRENAEGRYAPHSERVIAACCAPGYDDWRDTVFDDVYRLVSVAGHGEYAIILNG